MRHGGVKGIDEELSLFKRARRVAFLSDLVPGTRISLRQPDRSEVCATIVDYEERRRRHIVRIDGCDSQRSVSLEGSDFSILDSECAVTTIPMEVKKLPVATCVRLLCMSAATCLTILLTCQVLPAAPSTAILAPSTSTPTSALCDLAGTCWRRRNRFGQMRSLRVRVAPTAVR